MANIVVVDDDASVREILEEILSAAGHRVRSATDGADALTVLDRERPDLVITDLLMPHLNGLGLIAEIQKRFPGLSIIAISGGDRTGGFKFLSVARTYGVLTLDKPFRRTQLLAVVGQALLAGAASKESPQLPVRSSTPG
jgi:DNA-binding NtrC family response regulator